jgi:hypothetical protein
MTQPLRIVDDDDGEATRTICPICAESLQQTGCQDYPFMLTNGLMCSLI